MALVAHYKMNEQSVADGGTVLDSIGSNDGTWEGTGNQAVTLAESQMNTGFVFDGVDDVITVPADPTIDLNGKTALSISVWINPASDGEGDTGRIVDKMPAGAASGYRFYVVSEAAGFVKLTFDNRFAVNGQSTTNLANVPLNTWSYVAYSLNEDGDGKGKIYVNGVLQALSSDNPFTAPAVDDSAVVMQIGNVVSLDRTFDGTIDNLMIFDQALTQTEITSLYNLGTGTENFGDTDMTLVKRNITSPTAIGEPWMAQFYSEDASTASLVKAAVSGMQHFIKAINVTYAIGTVARYWVLVDSNESEITERVDMINGNPHFYHKFIKSLPCEPGEPIRILAEAAGAISVKLEGFSRQADPHKLGTVPQASTSVSASISSSPSTSVSSTPSASPSPSASISASASATPSVSTSLSASISSTPSVSTSPSSSPSASISASPSQSG